jgi:hypothetical protein
MCHSFRVMTITKTMTAPIPAAMTNATGVHAETVALSPFHPASHASQRARNRQGSQADFGCIRRSRAVLVPESANDHEALHAYSLPGIVMYVRNALLLADPFDVGSARRSYVHAWAGDRRAAAIRADGQR